MSSPCDQLDACIKHLIRQRCSPNEVSQQLLNQYPQLVKQAAQILKHIQAIEREFREQQHLKQSSGAHYQAHAADFFIIFHLAKFIPA